MAVQPWRKWARRGALGVSGAVVLLLGAAVLVFVSGMGRSIIVSALLSAVAGEGTAKTARIGGDWPGTLVLEGVEIADPAGNWLRVGRIDLSWQPWSLLTGRLVVSKLAIDKPTLLRMPVTTAPHETSGQRRINLPVAVTLKDLTLTGARLVTSGADADGGAIAFDGRGQGVLDQQTLRVALRLVRQGTIAEHLKLDATLDRRHHVLALDLDAVGRPHGLFARLAGLPDLPGFKLTAKGEGPAAQWDFRSLAHVETYGDATVQGQVSWTDRLLVDAKTTITPGQGLPQSLRDGLGETAQITGHFERDGSGDKARVALAGAGVTAQIEAHAGAAGLLGARRLEGKVRLRTKTSLALGMGGPILGPSQIEGTLSGTLETSRLALKIASNNVNASPYGLSQIDGDVDLTLRRIGARSRLAVKGKGTLGDFSAHGATVTDNAAWTVESKLDLATGAIDNAKFTVKSTPLSLSGTGGYGAKGQIALDLTLDAPELKALSPIAAVALDGQASATARLRRADRAADLTAKLEGKIEHGVIEGQALAPAAGPALVFDAALTRTPQSDLRLDAAQITGDHVSLSSAGGLMPALRVQATFDSDLAALGAFAGLKAAGAFTGRIDARGTLAQPVLSVALESPDAVIEDRKIGQTTLRFTPKDDARFPSGRAVLRARGSAGSADLAVPVAREDGVLTFGPIAGAAYGAKIIGDLRARDGDWTGKIEARMIDLGPAYGLLSGTPRAVAGRGRLRLQFDPKTALKVGLVLEDVYAADRDFAARSFSIDATRQGAWANLDLKASELRLPGLAGPIDMQTLSVTAKGPERALTWSFAADGLMDTQGQLRGEGRIDSKPGGRSVTLSAFTGSLYHEALALETPTVLTLGSSSTALAPVSLKIGSGRLGFSYTAKGRRQKGDLALSALPVAFVGRLIDADWPQGRITGMAGFDTLSVKPSGYIDITFSNALFTRRALAKASPLSGALTGHWDGRALSLKGQATRAPNPTAGSASPLRLTARLPLVRRGDGGLRLDPKGTLAGEVHWNGRLGTLWALLPYDLHRLDGAAVLNGTASGRWGAPKLEGTLQVTEGTYESLATGTRLKNIALDAKADASGADLTVEGEDGRGGHLSGRGHMALGEDAGIKANLSLRNLQIVGLDRVTAVASGALVLSGTTRAPQAAGNLTLDQVDASIPDRLPPSIPQLPVVRVDGLTGDVPQGLHMRITPAEPVADQALALDIDIDVPGRAFLRGRGLTSEWKGRINVTGDTGTPRLKGTLSVVRGDLAFAGRSYPLTRGRVVFDGGPDVNPDLDIATQRTVGAVQIALTLTGPASAPKLDITATPDRPKDEAMALFLFGKPASALSTLELLDVARSVATLTGVGGSGFDPVEKTRRALGLDVLTVGVGGTTGNSGSPTDVASSATLSAGRYLTDKIYVGVKQGARTDSSAVQLNYELTPHISVGTEAGPATGGAVNLNWSWDY